MGYGMKINAKRTRHQDSFRGAGDLAQVVVAQLVAIQRRAA